MFIQSNLLPEYQFTPQKEGEGGKRNEYSLITQNPILSVHKHVYSKATYNLREHHLPTFTHLLCCELVHS